MQMQSSGTGFQLVSRVFPMGVHSVAVVLKVAELFSFEATLFLQGVWLGRHFFELSNLKSEACWGRRGE